MKNGDNTLILKVKLYKIQYEICYPRIKKK